MTIQTDNAGNVTCFNYDQLHRLTDVSGWKNGSWYSGNGPCHRFRYDSSTNGAVSPPSGSSFANLEGRLVQAETDTCTAWPPTPVTDEWFSYDARGETTDLWQSTPHSGGYYHSWANYWANGLLDQLSSNIGYATSYAPDGEGRIYSVAGGTQLTSTLYNPAGLPTQVNFASGDSDSFTYDPNTNRMTQYKFTVNSQSVIGNPGWNANGTLGSLLITDPFNNSNTQSCSYTHDDLARLSSANCGSGWSQTFGYDAYGNITTSGNGQFQPGYNSNNQLLAPATYDANGNATSDEQHTYAWDAYGRPTALDGVSITYDALGRAVEWNNGSSTEVQYSPTGFMMYLLNGTSLVKAWVPMPAGTAEVWTPSTVFYRHADWLGSSRLASTTGRTIYYDTAYAPFGQPSVESGTTDRDFTGMDQDIVSGLYDFPAREYNGNEGRWSSPDPAGLASVNPADPQTWNRYAYVRNSPLMITDPSGLDPQPGCSPDDPSCPGAPPCTIEYCGPTILPELPGPIVYDVTNFSPPPTIGLPPGIFSNGPGFDYSWMGILKWAGLIHPCEDVGCFQNLLGCLNSWNQPVACGDPSAVIDCDDGTGWPGTGELPKNKVPSVCYQVFGTPPYRMEAAPPRRRLVITTKTINPTGLKRVGAVLGCIGNAAVGPEVGGPDVPPGRPSGQRAAQPTIGPLLNPAANSDAVDGIAGGIALANTTNSCLSTIKR